MGKVILSHAPSLYGTEDALVRYTMSADRETHYNILVVDDDFMVRKTVEMLLQCDGHTVAEAASGVDALLLLETGKFDLVFTDYFMPQMKGDELAAAIKRRSPDQRIVMITAYGESLRTRERPLAEIDMMIGKPFDIEVLRGAVTKCRPVLKQDFSL